MELARPPSASGRCWAAPAPGPHAAGTLQPGCWPTTVVGSAAVAWEGGRSAGWPVVAGLGAPA